MRAPNPINCMNLKHPPSAKAEFLIRRPVAAVFNAFVDPSVTTKFWFNKSSGQLESGKTLRWYWDICPEPTDVRVKALEANKRILIEWGSPEDFSTVEWLFTSRSNDTTWVSITSSGFRGDGDSVVNQALDAMGGFTLVLAAAKIFLEHNINLNIVADRFPDAR
jgi:uncharacterized protein YndB with AHSA1/START domain